MKKLYILFLLGSLLGFAQSPGDLVITEILQNPSGGDADGEYFELYNTTASAIDIEGWTIRDDGTDLHIINNGGPLLVPAGGYITLGRNGDTVVNGGITHDYIYADFFLGNSGDEVIIETPGAVIIDSVSYTGVTPWPDPDGPSMQLDSSILDATSNDDATNWCESSTNYGTPGAANEACAPTCTTFLGASDAVCDAITTSIDTYTATLDFTGGDVGTTFTVTSDFGTVGGDNPSMMAAGTIVVTGVPEGTDVTITVDDQTSGGGLCILTETITSPVCEPTGSVDMELQGIIDFTVLEGGASGKAIHVVATADIADISEYGLGVANNGGGTNGQEYTFDAIAVSNGDHILVARDLAAMENFFTTAGYNLFDHVLLANTDISQNGDDAIELFKNGVVVETFGDVNVDGTGESWEYTDSWAYKDVLGAIWPTDWSYGTVDCTDFDTGNPPATWTTFDTPCVYPFVSSLSNTEFNRDELSIYPNPVKNGLVNISTIIEGEKTIELFDITGRNVLSRTLTTNSIDVSNLNTGMYLMTITIANRSLTTKLIIE
jgi:hypothetical protein